MDGENILHSQQNIFSPVLYDTILFPNIEGFDFWVKVERPLFEKMVSYDT